MVSGEPGLSGQHPAGPIKVVSRGSTLCACDMGHDLPPIIGLKCVRLNADLDIGL